LFCYFDERLHESKLQIEGDFRIQIQYNSTRIILELLYQCMITEIDDGCAYPM
jgi:hypothetical protein